MKQPKLKVGQIWRETGLEVNVKSFEPNRGIWWWSDGAQCKQGYADKHMEFVPQNDLEWLAVNEPEWFHGDCRYVRRDDSRAMYCDDLGIGIDNNYIYYTQEQHRNERYRLGLDTKPHYEFINGQWSETK